MTQTFTDLLYHTVFSTKERRPLLDDEIFPELTHVIGGILHDRNGCLLECNAMPEHIHLLAVFPPTIEVAKMVSEIKSLSSGWVHRRFGNSKPFAWQNGYSCFTVGAGDKIRVITYIRGQQEHHRVKTFEDEYLEFLQRAGKTYDPRYVFD